MCYVKIPLLKTPLCPPEGVVKFLLFEKRIIIDEKLTLHRFVVGSSSFTHKNIPDTYEFMAFLALSSTLPFSRHSLSLLSSSVFVLLNECEVRRAASATLKCWRRISMYLCLQYREGYVENLGILLIFGNENSKHTQLIVRRKKFFLNPREGKNSVCLGQWERKREIMTKRTRRAEERKTVVGIWRVQKKMHSIFTRAHFQLGDQFFASAVFHTTTGVLSPLPPLLS